ncbi:MAG: M10 family metallopeptidase [Pseudohongiellaceae bacterium]
MDSKQTYLDSGQKITTKPFSGVSYIDALLNMGGGGWNEDNGNPIRWASDPFLTIPDSDSSITVISYSFAEGGDSKVPYSYTDDVGEISAIAFNAKQQDDIRASLTEIEKYIKVNFVEVEENKESGSVGTIRFAMNTITDEQGNYREGIAATADPVSLHPRGGDVFFNKWFVNGDFSTGVVPMAEGQGSVGSQTNIGDVHIMYHEIFHALGLEHPNDNRDKPFPDEINFKEYTVMAGEYRTDGASTFILQDKEYVIVSTPMAYDVAALQHLYGANLKHNDGDTIYKFDPSVPEIKLIWDGGGTDTLNFEEFSGNNTIDLKDGSYSTVPFNVWSSKNNISIAFGAVIEDVISGSGGDTITGNSSNNRITGGKGSDTIDGASGVDMAIYDANFIDASLNSFVDYESSGENIYLKTAWNVVLASDTDTLRNIERVKFNDTYIALDMNGNAGKVVKLLAAVLGKSSVENKEYVGAGLNALDNGMTYEGLMKAAIDVVFGPNPTGASVVGAFYENLAGSPAPQSILDEYGALLDDKTMTPTELGIAVAEHSLNATNIDLIGLASSGVEYMI